MNAAGISVYCRISAYFFVIPAHFDLEDQYPCVLIPNPVFGTQFLLMSFTCRCPEAPSAGVLTMEIISACDMEQAFEEALAFALNAGGPCVDNLENRPCGQSFKGISRQANPGWPGWFILDRMAEEGPLGGMKESGPALRGLVRSYYRATCWRGVCADIMPAPLAVALFDSAAVHGRNRAVRFLQEALNTLFGVRRLDVDGILRWDSRQALNVILGRHEWYLTLLVGELLRIRQGHCDSVACGDRGAVVRCGSRIRHLRALLESDSCQCGNIIPSRISGLGLNC